MARKPNLSNRPGLKRLEDLKVESPDAYDQVCREIVTTAGDNKGRPMDRLIDFKRDKMLSNLGYSEQELQEHVKTVYLEVIRDLKMPAAYAIKKIAELETLNAVQRLKDRANGHDASLTEFDLKVAHTLSELLKTLDKVGFKKKDEVHVHHHFHDEEGTVLEGDWKVAHEVTEDGKPRDIGDDDPGCDGPQ